MASTVVARIFFKAGDSVLRRTFASDNVLVRSTPKRVTMSSIVKQRVGGTTKVSQYVQNKSSTTWQRTLRVPDFYSMIQWVYDNAINNRIIDVELAPVDRGILLTCTDGTIMYEKFFGETDEYC